MAYAKMSKEELKALPEENEERFIALTTKNITLIIDRETGIEYGRTEGMSSFLTALVDRDGKPKVNKKFQ